MEVYVKANFALPFAKSTTVCCGQANCHAEDNYKQYGFRYVEHNVNKTYSKFNTFFSHSKGFAKYFFNSY